MRFGCCLNMLANAEDTAGFGRIEAAARVGFDYVELSLIDVMKLDHSAFKSLCERLKNAEIPCESCNNFFPKEVRLTGNERSFIRIRDYLYKALPRASELGAKTIVFGSSGARQVPQGFSNDVAMEQLAEDLVLISEIANNLVPQITIVIEPICRLETNILFSFKDGFELAKHVNCRNIKCLTDFYHMAVESEPLEDLYNSEGLLRHVHIARPKGRRFPAEGDGADYGQMFGALHLAGYDSRVSIEAYTDSFETDAKGALCCLRAMV